MTSPKPRRALREDEETTGAVSSTRAAAPMPTSGAPSISPSPSGDYLSHRQILVVLGIGQSVDMQLIRQRSRQPLPRLLHRHRLIGG